MGFNWGFKGLTLILLTCRIRWAPNNASRWQMGFNLAFKGLKAELNPICHLLALWGAHHILHISRIRVKYQWFLFNPWFITLMMMMMMMMMMIMLICSSCHLTDKAQEAWHEVLKDMMLRNYHQILARRRAGPFIDVILSLPVHGLVTPNHRFRKM